MTVRTGSEGPPIQAVNMNSDVMRQLIAALVPSQGVVGAGDCAVSALGTPNMSVNVASGFAFVLGTQLPPAQGEYAPLYNDAAVNLVVAASNPTNPRIDLVVLAVQDAAYSGGTNTPLLSVVTGTPSATPAVPTAPANSLVLAQIAVAANASSITSGVITDRRSRAGGSPFSLAGSPAGRFYLSTNQAVGTLWSQMVNLSVDYLRGGVAFVSNALVVPVAGVYTVKVAAFTVNAATGNTYVAAYRNGVLARQYAGYGASGAFAGGLVGADDILLAAGDSISLATLSAAQTISASATTTFLSLALVSV